MNRIDEKFKHLKKTGKKAFVAYITAGDPNLGTTYKLVPALEYAGVDIVELGVPFSDPMADGLTNQRAAERALQKGITLSGILETVRSLRKVSQVPIVLFTYLNPVFSYGIKRFAKDARKSGIDGVLLLDLPVEESSQYRKTLLASGIKLIYLIAPTSTNERISMISGKASGFLYYVSRTGVTGVRDSIERSVRPMIGKVRKNTKVPVVVGFGISTPEHVKTVSGYADGVVVGSAIVNKIEKNIGKKDLVKKVAGFVSSLTGVL